MRFLPIPIRFLFRPLACGMLLAMAVQIGTAHAQAGPPPAPSVVVATPLARKITLWDEYTGRFEAREQVEVRARVSGFMDKLHFKDGQIIRKGDLLFTIDQRPFLLSVEAAIADVERAKAQVALAENEVDRAEGLIRNQTITARDLDQRRANLASARASVQASEANLKVARLNLEWTEVRAPIDGRISDRRVDPGNLITGGQSGATLLTTIISIDPIYFIFETSEADYLRYSRLLQSGGRPQGRDAPNPVRVRLADEKDWSREGKMDFVDNQLNAKSGTIRARALFTNTDQFLTPGTFGRLQLYGGEVDGLLVPDSVIVSDQTNKVIFVVGEGNKVVPKPVVLGPIVDGLRVIKTGLSVADKVIITGIANPMVRPGVTVTPQQGEIKINTK
jgi:membrane fusion protein, multidrug efflux system